MTKHDLPPLALLREVEHRWPEAWKQYRQFRSMKGQPGFTDWPDWCYVPMAAAYAVVSGGGPHQLGPGEGTWIAAVAAAAAWRISKGIYRFDADIYRELIEQPLDGKLPTAVFYNLPEWGVYIETPGMRSHGFIAHLEHDNKTGIPELRLLLLHPDGSRLATLIMLGDWDLQTAVAKLDKSSRLQQTRMFGAPISPGLVGDMADQYQEMVIPYLQLVLYLCSTNREVTERRQRGRKRSKGRPSRQGAPKEIREWEVGLRIGASIRTYRNQQAISELDSDEDDAPTEEGRQQRSPRPHVRRAHWHSFWTGPRDGDRKLVLRWLPPTPVNVTEAEQLPAVLHKVIKDEDPA